MVSLHSGDHSDDCFSCNLYLFIYQPDTPMTYGGWNQLLNHCARYYTCWWWLDPLSVHSLLTNLQVALMAPSAHDFHTIFTRFSHDFYTIFTRFSHDFHTIFTRFSHDFHTIFTRFSHLIAGSLMLVSSYYFYFHFYFY